MPNSIVVHFRLDHETAAKLLAAATTLRITRTEIIRDSLRMWFDTLQKGESKVVEIPSIRV